jgi:hypothetical protein
VSRGWNRGNRVIGSMFRIIFFEIAIAPCGDSGEFGSRSEVQSCLRHVETHAWQQHHKSKISKDDADPARADLRTAMYPGDHHHLASAVDLSTDYSESSKITPRFRARRGEPAQAARQPDNEPSARRAPSWLYLKGSCIA